jgi:hypothetical protein
MKRIETIAAAHPRVGLVLSPDTASVGGQLSSIGFTPCDGTAGVDWVVTDRADAAIGLDVPVLRLTGKTSIFSLKQAVAALFAGRED